MQQVPKVEIAVSSKTYSDFNFGNQELRFNLKLALLPLVIWAVSLAKTIDLEGRFGISDFIYIIYYPIDGGA